MIKRFSALPILLRDKKITTKEAVAIILERFDKILNNSRLSLEIQEEAKNVFYEKLFDIMDMYESNEISYKYFIGLDFEIHKCVEKAIRKSLTLEINDLKQTCMNVVYPMFYVDKKIDTEILIDLIKPLLIEQEKEIFDLLFVKGFSKKEVCELTRLSSNDLRKIEKNIIRKGKRNLVKDKDNCVRRRKVDELQ
jgi:DNA-directed RNA polymerase specialized sigma subunit